MRVIGAGLPRTGTWSLKYALERLLGGPCYHMRVLHNRLDQVPIWRAAMDGESVDWSQIYDGYVAAVDWPTAAFWSELAEAYPDALILLSVRENADTWWRSATATVLDVARHEPPEGFAEWHAMVDALLRRDLGPDWTGEAVAKAGYERHVERVRASAPADRLLEWRAEDGWAPLCEALGVPVPDEPFPHLNTKRDWDSGRDRHPDLRA